MIRNFLREQRKIGTAAATLRISRNVVADDVRARSCAEITVAIAIAIAVVMSDAPPSGL